MADLQDSPLILGWYAGSGTIQLPGGGTIQLSAGSTGTQTLPAAQPVSVVPTVATGTSLSVNVGLILVAVLGVVALVVLLR